MVKRGSGNVAPLSPIRSFENPFANFCIEQAGQVAYYFLASQVNHIVSREISEKFKKLKKDSGYFVKELDCSICKGRKICKLMISIIQKIYIRIYIMIVF